MTLGSLFDGIAGFPLAAERQGIKTVWISEIEANCIEIAKRHFPDAENLGDITEIDGGSIPAVDIISFGSPCQDLSVAGGQKGLDGARSGLFMEAVRIVREMRKKTNGEYPKYIIWENVAGAFSSNKGEDFRRVLEEITESNIPMPKSGKWANAGMVGIERAGGGRFSVPHGGCLMLNFGECPNVENVSILSAILEADVPDKYFLSAKACWGIIRRAQDIIRVLQSSDRLQIKKGKTLIYAGYVASMEHTDIEEEILSAEVKRFQAVPEIRHKEWQKRGLMKPLQPEETPEYNFSDLQMSIYHTITI